MSTERYRPWRTVQELNADQLYRWRLSLLEHEVAALEQTAAGYSEATSARSVIGLPVNADAPLQALLDAARHRPAA